MIRRTRPSLTYANVMSTIAVGLALGGTSYAAVALPRNSVGSAQLKAKAVKAADLGSNAVTSAKVKDRSLLAKDFAPGALPAGAIGAAGATGSTGATGAPGQMGLMGEMGVQGPPGAFGQVSVQRTDFMAPDNMTTSVQVICAFGQRVIAGGSSIDETTSDDVHEVVSRPFRSTPGADPVDNTRPVDGETFNAWRVSIRNPAGGTGAANAHAWAICAQA